MGDRRPHGPAGAPAGGDWRGTGVQSACVRLLLSNLIAWHVVLIVWLSLLRRRGSPCHAVEFEGFAVYPSPFQAHGTITLLSLAGQALSEGCPFSGQNKDAPSVAGDPSFVFMYTKLVWGHSAPAELFWR